MKVTRDSLYILKTEGLNFRDVKSLKATARRLELNGSVSKFLLIEKFSDETSKFHGPFNTLSDLERYVESENIEE